MLRVSERGPLGGPASTARGGASVCEKESVRPCVRLCVLPRCPSLR